MNIKNYIACPDFPCQDVSTSYYLLPDIDIEPENIKIVMITEAPPQAADDYFYAPGNPFYMQTTRQAFRDAGINVNSVHDILNMGVYITTAIKCAKVGYGVSSKTINNCSKILEKEIGLFNNIQVYMLMGDVAIKALNYIAKHDIGERVIPAGSTYKIRKDQFFYGKRRVFPSYVPTGQNYLIEKSKRRMIAEDITEALKLINHEA